MISDDQIRATLTLAAIAQQRWELAVIGAGPAGAIAARQAARAGVRVLLVDRAAFPRHKVCGCCLNGAALSVLAEVGLAELPGRCHAPQLREFHLASGGRFARVPLATGVSLSRERLDAELIKAAIAAGADFLDDTQALIDGPGAAGRGLELKREGTRIVVAANMIVIASGLGSRLFAQQPSEQQQTWSASRVGAGTVLAEVTSDFASGRIYMACHRDGYVGLVRLEDERLDIAAAVDGAAIKRSGGIAPLVAGILRDAGLPVPPGTAAAKWHGTVKLTQHRHHVAGDKYFVVGDAAGYVEPFTGEGMAWALATGTAVVPYVLAALAGHQQVAQVGWANKRRELIGRRARMCRIVSTLLRYPALVNVAVRVLDRAPGLAQPVVKSLNASFAMDAVQRQEDVHDQF